MISISNFYQYYHLANHSNDISHVSQFVFLRIIVNIPRVAVGRSAGRGPLSTKKCNVCQTLCFTIVNGGRLWFHTVVDVDDVLSC